MRQQFGKFVNKLGLGRMTEGEYRANLSGINMFFGAVLGVVLAGIEKLNSFQFGFVLVLLAAVVASIMFISSSRHRVAYSVYAVAMSLATPRLVDLILKTTDAIPAKIVPTLLAWTLMTVLVEFWARDQNSPQDQA
jgi:drug/metabolite transporter (DMT)-like permease